MNSPKVAAALRALADAIEEGGQDAQAPAEAPAPAPQKRGRGRPVKGEETAAPAPAPAPAPVEAADPFAAETAAPAPAAPVASLADVRAALTALRAVTNQDIALKVLKDAGGASNVTELKPEKYDAVVAAAKAAAVPTTPAAEADPFGETTAAPAAAPSKPLTIEDVKAAVVAAQKRTGTDTVQKVVMAHGGKAADPTGGAEKPSLKALPEAQFAACIAAINALPSTK